MITTLLDLVILISYINNNVPVLRRPNYNNISVSKYKYRAVDFPIIL